MVVVVVVTRPSAESKSENSRNQFPLESGHCPRSLHLGSFSATAATLTSHLPRPLISLISPHCALRETGDEDENAMVCVGGCCSGGSQMSVAEGGSGDPVLGSFNHRHQQQTFTVSLVSTQYLDTQYLNT